MNRIPLVSIIIPVYNGANFVADAIESALAQTYKNIEILVINDGSSDDGATDAIIKRYASRVRYIVKENGGVATAINLGIREMKGDYFSWLSHDDLYFPNKIESQMNLLSNLNFSDVVVYSGHINLIEEKRKSHPVRHKMSRDLHFRAKEIVANNKIHGCSLLIPRKAFDKVGLFDEKLRVAQDYEMWFRIARNFPFRYQDETLVIGRIHKKQVGVRLHDRVLIENDDFRLSCLKQLDNGEIASLGRGSISLGLLYLSMRMVRMGCPKSHDHISTLLKTMTSDRFSTVREKHSAAFAIGVDFAYVTLVLMARKIKLTSRKMIRYC